MEKCWFLWPGTLTHRKWSYITSHWFLNLGLRDSKSRFSSIISKFHAENSIDFFFLNLFSEYGLSFHIIQVFHVPDADGPIKTLTFGERRKKTTKFEITSSSSPWSCWEFFWSSTNVLRLGYPGDRERTGVQARFESLKDLDGSVPIIPHLSAFDSPIQPRSWCCQTISIPQKHLFSTPTYG